jgi:hypothetical protein
VAGKSFYGPSTIKRSRRTQAQMDAFHDALLVIVNEQPPMTIRQAYYQAEVRGLVEKEETGYRKVQQGITKLRETGRLPYALIVDNTRWQRRATTNRSAVDMVLE